MKHDKAKFLLQDCLDGQLSVSDAEAIRRHLNECEACASEFERLEHLIRAARALPTEITPGRDLWNAVAKRLENGDADLPAESGPERRSSWRRPLTLVAAAAALVLTLLAMNRFLDDSENLNRLPLAVRETGSLDLLADATVNALEAECSAADPGVEALVATEAEEGGEDLNPLIENLQIVNNAIDQARRAWKANPGNSHLARMLISAYQAKLALQEQVGHIAERT